MSWHLAPIAAFDTAMWREQWAVGFREYLAKQGKPEPVDGHWPIRPYEVAS